MRTSLAFLERLESRLLLKSSAAQAVVTDLAEASAFCGENQVVYGRFCSDIRNPRQIPFAMLA
jgi:hypothetical protein